MAIVINGSGTVTGLAVGGLPDGTVDSGTLATNSVDSAELIDGAVDDSHIGALAASKLTGALPAISGASLTGITNNAGSCVFRVHHDAGSWAAISTTTKIILNAEWEDSDGVYNTSSGHFTAPAAGVYFFYANFYTGNADSSNGFRFRKNDSSTAIEDLHGQWGSYISQSDSSDCMVSWQVVITLSANDTISVWTGTGSDIYYGHSYWGGFRLS